MRSSNNRWSRPGLCTCTPSPYLLLQLRNVMRDKKQDLKRIREEEAELRSRVDGAERTLTAYESEIAHIEVGEAAARAVRLSGHFFTRFQTRSCEFTTCWSAALCGRACRHVPVACNCQLALPTFAARGVWPQTRAGQ